MTMQMSRHIAKRKTKRSLSHARCVLVAVLLLAIVGTHSANAQMVRRTPPALPSSFYGVVIVNGSNPATGGRVVAWVQDVPVVATVTFRYDGKIVYAINVPGDDPATPSVEGGQPGASARFTVDGQPALPVARWRSGTNLRLDLAVTHAEQ